MGEKDITEKVLEGYNDVFSDIVNVLLFHGETIMKPDELEEQMPRSAYKADGKVREIERDVVKRWRSENVRIACIGMENQTAQDPDLPLRVIGYDGTEYRAQLNQKKQTQRYPVVTLVLYFDPNRNWTGPLSLYERLDIPECIRPFVNDYKVNLFEISRLTEEQVKMFQSDFRVVADYFVQKRTTGDYMAMPVELKHVQETLSLMSVMTRDHRFEEVYTNNQGKEIRTMCDVLDRIESKGRVEGRAEGKAEMTRSLYKQGFSIEMIVKTANVDEKTVKEWLNLK